MPRQRKDETKTSQTIHLEGLILIAVEKYHQTFTGKREWNFSRTMNKIIEQWIEKTPPAMRGYEKP